MDSKLRAIVANVFAVAVDQIDASTDTKSEPRWDSLRHMNLIFALEEAYGVRFTDDEIPLLTSVRAIESALAQRGH
jgi:acyl carrier protein